MAPASCIFCQTPRSAVKLTNEDVLSTWIDDVLTSSVLGPGRSFERTVLTGDGNESQKSRPAHKLATIKVPAVCGPCNNGWMSGYDGRVKHWLKHAILGYNISLSIDQQLTVATWATMKTWCWNLAGARHRRSSPKMIATCCTTSVGHPHTYKCAWQLLSRTARQSVFVTM